MSAAIAQTGDCLLRVVGTTRELGRHMKKLNRRVLSLDLSTIRNLSGDQLVAAAGGSLISTDFDACVTSGCTKSPDASGCKHRMM